MRPFIHAILVLGALTLSGCSSVPFLKKSVVLNCPNYYILEDAATLTQFRDGPGRDITDILAKAKIGEMQLGCTSDIDSDTNSGKMTIEISPIIAAEMGSANTTEKATLPYFVVVTDPSKNILYREELKVDVSFKGNRTQVILLAPPTSVDIPITPKIKNDYYKIYSGFVLTQDQVDYNRKAIQDRLR
ncbi:MAG: hypothetical protein NWR87_05020 [Rhodospirillales bacterium]|jgi:hypothetical protein|nr:hypothetical protein [Rhodospirillales bacterium]